MELCECGHAKGAHSAEPEYSQPFGLGSVCYGCGCPEYKPRHDARYDPDDVADQGSSDEGYAYSGLGKVRR